MASQCSAPNCRRPIRARGWCRKHYELWRQYGILDQDQVRLYRSALRFWSRVKFTQSCWLWQAAKDRKSYGQVRIRGRLYRAHRWAYEFCIGRIPHGLQIDHLCRVTSCVNPDHLEAVTNQENTLRGDTMPWRLAAKTHCPKGHEYSAENTYRPSRWLRALAFL